jgi:hypothetical protein
VACDIVATPGATNATGYATIAQGDAYFAVGAHLFGATWLAATEDQKCAGLKMATRLLDQWYEWFGSPAAYTQALAFPRSGLTTRTGNAQSVTAIPDDLVGATCELAQALLVADVRADSDIEVQKITSLKVGAIELAFGDGVRAKAISDKVQAFLNFWGQLRDARPVSTRLLRG